MLRSLIFGRQGEMVMVGTTVDFELLTIAEAATALRISRSKLYQLAEDGRVPTVRVPGCAKILFRRAELERALTPKQPTQRANR